MSFLTLIIKHIFIHYLIQKVLHLLLYNVNRQRNDNPKTVKFTIYKLKPYSEKTLPKTY